MCIHLYLQLPADFSTRASHLQDADLLLILGTSLTVWPFAGLTRFVPQSCPRVLFNLEPAGDIGTRVNDVELLGKCDDVVRELCRHLGWEQELDKEWALTAVGRVLSQEEAKDRQAREAQEGEAHARVAAKKRANKGVPHLSDVQVDHLTAAIAKKLDLEDKKDGEETNEEDKEGAGIQESPSSKTDDAAHAVEGKSTMTSTQTADTSEKPMKL
jgi:NAD+-dependent protein deacetylase SIR2